MAVGAAAASTTQVRMVASETNTLVRKYITAGSRMNFTGKIGQSLPPYSLAAERFRSYYSQ